MLLDFMFAPMNFLYNLKYMGIGLLVIFIAIGLIIGATFLLNSAMLGLEKKKSKEEKDEKK